MKRKYTRYLFAGFYLVYFLCCLLLFYKQSIGAYISDLTEHIQFGLNGEGYSIVYFTYGVLYKLFHNTYGIALLLAGICLLTVLMLYFFLTAYKKNIDKVWAQIIAIITCFVMPVYIPAIYDHRYAGTLPPQAWHNSTYIIMRGIGIAVLYLYFKIEKEYLYKLEWKKSILFALGLLIINMVKPNFILAFAPMMAVWLIRDLFMGNTGEWKNRLFQIVKFGALILPSFLVLFFQNTVLFGQNTGNTISFTFGQVFFTDGNGFLKLFFSMAFPFLVLLKNRDVFKKDKVYCSVWLMWLFAFLEYFFLCETGERSHHGNFTWGVMFCVFMVFAVSICKFGANLKKNNSISEVAYKCLGICFLTLHLLAGISYFIQLLFGDNYFV